MAEIADTAVASQDTSVPTKGIAQEGEIPTDVEEVHSPLPIAVAVPINNNNNQASSGSEPADEEDQNLITPVQNISRYLTNLEANHPVQTYITTEEHHDTISQLLHKMDYIASVMQNIVSYREEDRQKYEQAIATAVTAHWEDLAAMREEIRIQQEEDQQCAPNQKEEDRGIIATKEDVLSMTKTTKDWMADQNQKINEALSYADAAAKKIFTDGLTSLTETVREDIAAKFAQATTEHEETMRINREACTAALDKIKRYEEQYSRLAKGASQYQQLKAKWEEVEQKAIATQLNVKNMVARGMANASRPKILPTPTRLFGTAIMWMTL